MKFTAFSLITAFTVTVSGLALEPRDPQASPASQSHYEVKLDVLPSFPPVTTPGVELSTKATVTKEKRGELAKRATLTVDIYQDINYGGRHEGLVTNTQTCYNLGNGWNDQISSLKVPSGFGCYFYWDGGCDPNGSWLRVTGPYDVPDLRTYGYNDVISSYLCYN